MDNLTNLINFDKEYGNKIIGVDEVGRGCLAGPIVSCGVYIDYNKENLNNLGLEKLNDSKKLSEKNRIVLSKIINQNLKVYINLYSANTIDKFGLHNCNLLALKNSAQFFIKENEITLSDGYKIDVNNSFKIIKGDSKSAAISCASIVAKNFRDNYMKLLAQQYPQYSFESHKGYGTKKHLEAIKKFGYTNFHRKSFNINLDF